MTDTKCLPCKQHTNTTKQMTTKEEIAAFQKKKLVESVGVVSYLTLYENINTLYLLFVVAAMLINDIIGMDNKERQKGKGTYE